MRVFIPVASVLVLTGCTVTLPFQHRVSYSTVSSVKTAEKKPGGPVSLKWEPTTFPERVDIQGASGFVGGGSRTRIPTGIAIAQRVTELMDAMVGVQDSGSPVTIEVIQATSTFEYSAGFLNVTPSIDKAGCTFDAKFTHGGKTWSKKFTGELKDPVIGGSSQVALLEKVWDDIAVQVCKDLVANL